MTRMTGPDCAVMCNLINTHTHTHIRKSYRVFFTRRARYHKSYGIQSVHIYIRNILQYRPRSPLSMANPMVKWHTYLSPYVLYLCIVITYSKSMDQPRKVANPARRQLNRKN